VATGLIGRHTAVVITDRSRRRVTRVLAAVVVLDVAYWVAWSADRSLVASNTRPAYYEFENAFPLADAWLALCCAGALVGLRRRTATTLLWLLMAAGAGIYLFSMDVLYDLEHGIWWSSGGGVIELGINLLTLAVALVLLRWTWLNRAELLDAP
jgi:hypothetical protein